MSKKLNPTIVHTALACLVVALLAACSPYGYSDVGLGIAVGGPPPPFHEEYRAYAPGPGYYWVPGYYDRVGADWLWVAGSWQLPPQHRARWVAPYYTQRHGRWTYRRGYWH
jgi:hypothetical protein